MTSAEFFKFTITPPASDLWIMSGDTIFRTIGYPISLAYFDASFSVDATLNFVTGMLYSVQIIFASGSRRAFLPSFFAWLMIFVVWFNFYSSVDVFVYVMFCWFKIVLLMNRWSVCLELLVVVLVMYTSTLTCSKT